MMVSEFTLQLGGAMQSAELEMKRMRVASMHTTTNPLCMNTSLQTNLPTNMSMIM
jgi:hypothetical protein